jgi:hypothetical protein
MPGPYRSVLNKHLEQIARLRDNDPPTPYEEIAAILLKDHGIKIRPSSIWNFVKARAEGKEPRNVAKISKKYLQVESPPEPSPPEIHDRKEEPEDSQKPGDKYRKAVLDDQPKPAKLFDETHLN